MFSLIGICDDPVKKYRIGILGLGEGRSILAAAQESPRWEIAGVCDLDESLCRQRSQEFDLATHTTSYDEMLNWTDLDVVGIFTPDSLHAEHMLKALAAGKHVICTKPVVDSLARGEELIEAQRRAGREVLVGHSYRFFQTFLRQREDFEKGIHGDLVSCEASYNGDKRKGAAGRRGKNGEVNWLYSGLGHAVDLVFWYLGEIDEVCGYAVLSNAGRALGSQVPDCFHVSLRAKSGVIGQASGIYGAPRAHPQASPAAGCTLRGDKATTTATNPTFDYFAVVDGVPPTRETFIDDGGYYFRWGGSSYHAGEFQNYLNHFAQCLDEGLSPEPDLHSGLYVIAILEALERCLQRSSPVKVDDVLKERSLAGKLRLPRKPHSSFTYAH